MVSLLLFRNVFEVWHIIGIQVPAENLFFFENLRIFEYSLCACSRKCLHKITNATYHAATMPFFQKICCCGKVFCLDRMYSELGLDFILDWEKIYFVVFHNDVSFITEMLRRNIISPSLGINGLRSATFPFNASKRRTTCSIEFPRIVIRRKIIFHISLNKEWEGVVMFVEAVSWWGLFNMVEELINLLELLLLCCKFLMPSQL